MNHGTVLLSLACNSQAGLRRKAFGSCRDSVTVCVQRSVVLDRPRLQQVKIAYGTAASGIRARPQLSSTPTAIVTKDVERIRPDL